MLMIGRGGGVGKGREEGSWEGGRVKSGKSSYLLFLMQTSTKRLSKSHLWAAAEERRTMTRRPACHGKRAAEGVLVVVDTVVAGEEEERGGTAAVAEERERAGTVGRGQEQGRQQLRLKEEEEQSG